jgi:hypothetical protein
MPKKTLFPEIAHVILGHHSDGELNSIYEVEAQSVALICREVLGAPAPECRRWNECIDRPCGLQSLPVAAKCWSRLFRDPISPHRSFAQVARDN